MNENKDLFVKSMIEAGYSEARALAEWNKYQEDTSEIQRLNKVFEGYVGPHASGVMLGAKYFERKN